MKIDPIGTQPLQFSKKSLVDTPVAPGGDESLISGKQTPLQLIPNPNKLNPAPGAKIYQGFDRANLNPKVRPGDDFYQYAVGGWLASHPIPSDKSAWGTFDILAEDNLAKCNNILKEASQNPAASPDASWKKIGDFYASGMNEQAIEAAGTKPLAAEFARIDGMKDLKDLQGTIAHFHSIGVNTAFNFGSEQDNLNPETVIGGAYQGGLGLPQRDYYLNDDDKSKQTRQQYIDHVSNMFQLMGDDPATAQANAKTVMEMETELAKASLSKADLRDPYKTYHIYDKQQLAQLTPHFSWDQYFADRGRPDLAKINMGTPDFFKELDTQLSSRPLSDWKTYLRWDLINTTAPYLSSKFAKADFDFYSHTLRGVQTMPDRWKDVGENADGLLGEAVGQEYVKRYFPPEAKARVLGMIDNMKSVLRDKITNAAWMDDATRKEAFAKVDTFQAKIGYPDKWKDYSGFNVDRNAPYVTNVLNGMAFSEKEQLDKIGKPFDHTQWLMNPQEVNAYYNPTENCIVFPAGILQPPFFDMNADDAANYGGIGVVMDHEMGHGFDDQGAQFDSKGQMRNWWQKSAADAFQKIVAGVKKEYSEFEFDGLHVVGDNVSGESMGDLSGAEISYAAFEKATAGKPQPVSLDGFTPKQRFFLNFALCFARNMTPEESRKRMITDEHPLSQFRVNGTLANSLPFREAFGLKNGDPMVRPEADRNTIWGTKTDAAGDAKKDTAA